MNTIKSIASVLGYTDMYTEGQGSIVLDRIMRVQGKITAEPGTQKFEEEVLDIDSQLNEIGDFAMAQLVGIVTAGPAPKINKIKCVAKGQRIKVVSESGVRFSFGPAWCESIKLGKGISTAEINREKLNMHGMHVGIKNPEKMAAKDLAAAIAKKMVAQEELAAVT